MRAALRELTEEYSAALRDYCAGGGEAELHRGYQLGRRAVGDGMGVLEMAALHQEALVAALLEMLAGGEGTRIARRASEFLAESLAPFELNRRGFEEANAVLADLNKGLARRLSTALQDFETAQGELLEQKRSERVKDEFISVVSHELRTPLTSIHGALNLLKSGLGGRLNAQGQRLLDVAYRNSQRLVRLVSDVLDLQKIRAGSMSFNLRPVAVDGLLEQAIEANQAYASQLGVALVLKGAPAGALVYADADRLMQVMANLISNAARFSPAREVVDVEGTRAASEIHVSVTDRGPGIPEEFRARIFQPFAQAGTAASKGGSGLGLSISKAIVEYLGGAIGFETEPGRTTFYFELPEWREGGTWGEAGGPD